MATDVRKHDYDASDLKDHRGIPYCKCGLPKANQCHGLTLTPEEVRLAEKRRLGERERP